MSRLHCALSDLVGDQEEVEPSVLHLGLLNKASVNVGPLGRIVDLGPLSLEESLSYALVDDNESESRLSLGTVFLAKNLLELVEFFLDDLVAHGIAYAVSVNEDVLGQAPLVVVPVASEGVLEVLLQDVRGDDLLSLLLLRMGLGVELAHVGVVGGYKTDQTLLDFVAYVDSYEHGFSGDFRVKVHSPEVSTKFCIDLTEDIHVDLVFIFIESLGSDKLGDHRIVRVDLVLDGGVEVLLFDFVRHNDHEEKDLVRTCLARHHIVVEVRVYGVFEVLDTGIRLEAHDVCVFDEDIEPSVL